LKSRGNGIIKKREVDFGLGKGDNKKIGDKNYG